MYRYFRLILYPLELKDKMANSKDKNQDHHKIYHLLYPKNMKVILKRAGFSNIKIGEIKEMKNSYYIIGVKV